MIKPIEKSDVFIQSRFKNIGPLQEICSFCKVKTKWQVELLMETYFPSQQEGVGDRRGFPHNRIDSIGIG